MFSKFWSNIHIKSLSFQQTIGCLDSSCAFSNMCYRSSSHPQILVVNNSSMHEQLAILSVQYFSYIYIYIYMYIWNILNLQFILCSTSNHISSLLTNLFNKYGYHFSFHRSMMKEFTILSTPDLCFILFTDVWWKIHDFQFQPVHIRRYFSNISRHWIHNSSLEQLVKLFLSFFLFHFQQGSNKT